MGQTMCIKLYNTFPRVQPRLANGEANIHTHCEIMQRGKYNQPENKMQQERLEPKTSSNLSSNTMLSYQ